MTKSNFPLEHIVDERERVVYIRIDSAITAMGIPNLLKQFYPGYKGEIVSEERFKSMQPNPGSL